MQKNPFRFLCISLIIVILDQVTKFLARYYSPDEVSIIGEFIMLTHVQNSGAAFSMSLGSDMFNRVFFSCVTFIMIFVILYMLKKSKALLEKLAFSFIIAGAVGNLIDRVVFGSVTDFLDFDFFTINIPKWNFYMDRWPIFNIADSSIVVAIVLLFIYILFLEKNTQPEDINDK